MTALGVDALDVRESVRAVLARESTLDAVRLAAEDPERWRAAWALAGELGWPGLAVPEELGGLGFPLVAQAAILEEAGSALFVAPLVSTTIAANVLCESAEGPARDDALRAIAGGGAATLAVGPELESTRPGTLQGAVAHVPDAGRATIAVVLAGAGEAAELHVADAGGDVASRDGGPGPDPNRPVGTLRFAGAPAAPLPGAQPARVEAIARVLQAAELVGVAARALDVAVAHAGGRRQFGRLIGEFQGVKHRLADDYVGLERARSLTAAAAAAVDERASVTTLETLSRMAKAAAGEAAMTGVRDAIQVLGALGITAECELPWLLRRARVGSQLLGDARRHYAWLGTAPPAGEATADGPAAEYGRWLEALLPADYAARPAAYRADDALRAAHQRAAFDEGWLVPQWPAGLGGRGLGPFETIAVRLEAARRQAPRLPSIQSVGVIAPALREFGTPRQVERLLVPTLRGELTWALGMSEPDAGSDLAALRTRATAVEGGFRVSGQKVWTTQAHTSHWAMLYCRTDPGAARHRGISCLLLDLSRAEGVTVREIETGWPGTEVFCELFLDDTFVADEWLLGELHGGWKVAMSALNHERDMIWVNAYVDVQRVLRAAERFAAGALAGERFAAGALDPHLAIERGRLATDATALHATGMRALASEVAGRPNPEFSVLKLLGTEAVQRACDLALAAAGGDGLDDAELLLEDFDALGATIFGGTSEIQRNIIGERVLGLPRG